MKNLSKLSTLIKQERKALLAQWRQQVRELSSARDLDNETLNDHIPSLLDELAEALEDGSNATIAATLNVDSAQIHGLQRFKDDFDIQEVVAEYNILRACIHDLADKNGFDLQGKPFHIINRVFDKAIGIALQTYANQRALEVRQRREEYLAFVAHDLRTPLFAISLASRVLEKTLPSKGYSADSAQMLKSMRRSVQQLEELVRKVLEENTNVQTDSGVKIVPRTFDLWPLVEALLEELETVAQDASTQLINKVPDDLVVFADASLLKRVFQNLIANAIRYTPGGTVVVEAKELVTKAVVECSVSDNGAGIPEELLGKVFDKGETDGEDEGGMGLGLAIVQTFIEAHEGTINVESKAGKGTSFRFSLPIKVHV